MKAPHLVDGLRPLLDALSREAPEHFRAVFLDGDRLELWSSERALVDAGLVDRRGRPRVRLFDFHGHFIATDRLDYKGEDQVFSLMFEQHYLVRNTSLKDGDDVLELCSGSGANCIFAAAKASRVTGVDISPRALAFAEFNRALNAPDRPIEFLKGSLFEPLASDRRFDLVLINPPFEYVPPGRTHYLHSDGGSDGLRVIRACLEEAPRRLAEGGRFEIVTYSPGSEERPALLDLLEGAFPDHDIECHLLDVEPIAAHLRAIRLSRRKREAWRRSLEEQGYTRNYFLFCRVTPGAGGRSVLKPHEEVEECWRLSG